MLPLPHFHSLLTLLQCSYGAPNAIQGTLFCTSAYLNIVQILQKSYKMVPLVHFYAHAHLQTFMCSWQNPFQMSSWRLQKWYPWYTFYTFQEFGLPRRNFDKIFEHPRFLQKSYKTVPWYTFLIIRICQHRCFTGADHTKLWFFWSRKCCKVLQKIHFRDIALPRVLQIIHFGEPEVRDPLQKIHFRDSQHALPGCVSEFSLNANVVDMCLKLPLAPQVSSTCPQVEHNLAQLALKLSSTWLNLVSMWASVHLTCHHLGFVNVSLSLSPFSFFFCSLSFYLCLSQEQVGSVLE